MKVLLEIPDHKAASFMDVLNSIPYVKTKKIDDAKEELIADIKQAVEELKLIREGKLEGKNAIDFLNEL